MGNLQTGGAVPPKKLARAVNGEQWMGDERITSIMFIAVNRSEDKRATKRHICEALAEYKVISIMASFVYNDHTEEF